MHANINVFKSLTLLLLFSQLNACAVMSKTDCINANWQQEGYNVGASGETNVSDAFNKRDKRCSRYGTRADWSEFENGYALGIDEYCAVSNAIRLGTRGASKAVQTCPDSDYFGFYQAFSAGYKLYELNQAVRQADQNIGHLKNSIYQHQRERESLRRRLDSKQLSEDERSLTVKRSRRLRRQIRYLRSEISDYQSRLYSHQRAADNYARYLEEQFGDDTY